MNVQRVDANGIEIAYESFGDPADPPIVLIMGLGTQMLAWPEPVCQELADHGFHVIRFDNRDIGLSTHLDGRPAPTPLEVALRRRRPAYRIEDMADDTTAMIDALELGPVHLVGASMGGFIAQTVALQRPELVASLTLVMTSTGSRWVGRTTPKLLAVLVRRKPANGRAAAIEASVQMSRLIRSPGYEFDEERVRELAEQSYERGYDDAGQVRQFGAVIAQSDRTAELYRIAVPTVVLHGLHDPLVATSGGIAVARAIPGARFVGYHGMGHDLPVPLWPELITEIRAVAARVRPSNQPAPTKESV